MSGKRILIIEDHLRSAEALKGMIQRRGGAVEIVGTLAEAETLLQLRDASGPRIDLIVSDLAVPDSDAVHTLDWLASMTERGYAVCAMSGADDPALVERAAKDKICFILKGMRAEGIVEQILYALMRSDPGYAHTAAQSIVSNRKHVREIPAHIGAWFFQDWPKWVQICSGVAGAVVTLGTIVTMSAAAVHQFSTAAVTVESNSEMTRSLAATNAIQNAHIAENDRKIRSVEDDRLKIIEALAVLDKTTSKLDDKIDKITDMLREDHEEVVSMWQQRLSGRTNADLWRAGDTRLEPPKQP